MGVVGTPAVVVRDVGRGGEGGGGAARVAATIVACMLALARSSGRRRVHQQQVRELAGGDRLGESWQGVGG